MNAIARQLASYDLLRDIIEGVPIRIFWKDRDGRFLGCNSLFARDAGFSAPEDLVGKTDFDMGWKEQAELYRSDDARVMDAGEAILNYEEPQDGPDGAMRWLRTSKVPLRNDAGDVIGILGIYEDITAQKQVEDELRLTRFVSDHAPEAIAWIDREARLCYVNEAQCRELGYSREELLDMDVSGIDPDFPPGAWPAHWQELQQHGSLSIETRHRRKDGSVVPVEVVANFVRYGEHEYNVAFARYIGERKQAERALQESEQRFRDLFEHSPDPCWIINEANMFTLCNQAAADILGFDSVEELQATHPSKLSPPTQPDGRDSFEKANAMMAMAHERGVHRFEWEHLHHNGEPFPVEVTLARIEIAGKKQLYCIWRDISERKKTEEHLRQEAGLRSQLLEQAAEGIALWRPSHDARFAEFLVWNGRMREITGYSMGEINRIGWLQAIYPDEAMREKARERMQAVLDGEVNRGSVFEAATKEGEPRVLNISSAPVQGFADETCVLAVIQDITAERHQQEKLAASEKRFATLFDSSSDGIFIVDMQGNFLDINRTAHERLGYGKAEMMQLGIRALDTPEYAVRVPERLAKVLAEGGAVFETAHRRKDGTVMPVEINARIIELEGERVVFSVVRDISERRQFEERLRHSQKMEAIGTLVSGIAHDFNNMLAAIQGNLFLARQELSEQPLADEKLANIELLSDRAAEMVQQLLTFARKDAVSMRAFTLNAFMSESYRLNRTAVPENIDYHLELCEEPLCIRGDATQLQQMMMNLVNNAVDAVAGVEAPQIVCSLSPFMADDSFRQRHPELPEERYALIRVQDNGHGIEETHLEKIFEPFFTTKEVGKGTGLGLAMLYGAVQTHDGAVELESRKGLGTTFRIYLPLFEEGVQQKPTLDHTGQMIATGRGETLLLVDDEASLREVGRQVLGKMGYRVQVANDGIEALEMLRRSEEPVALVISDVIMPRMGGAELLSELRGIDATLPVILATGYDKDHVLDPSNGDAFCQVINKPFHFGELAAMIRAMLDTRASDA
jgi:PAS domain S-box-containing protein